MTTTSRNDETVSATLQYLAKNATNGGDTMPVYHASQAGDAQEAQHEGNFEFRQVTIRNGRTLDELSLDVQGFRLIQHSSSVSDFYNQDQLETIYSPELEKLLLASIPGATRIHIFDHTRRASTATLRTERQMREPSSVIHNDYTPASAEKRLHDLLGGVKSARFSIVNVWRSIDSECPVESWPMCFCDSTSLAENDLVSVKRVAVNRIGEIQMAQYSPKHSWYYFPSMTREEVAVFKTYDSSNYCNRFTIHTAFDLRKENARPRQSIESRAFVLYD